MNASTGRYLRPLALHENRVDTRDLGAVMSGLPRRGDKNKHRGLSLSAIWWAVITWCESNLTLLGGVMHTGSPLMASKRMVLGERRSITVNRLVYAFDYTRVE